VPSNAISAAAEDAILPLIIFTLVFAFAVARLPEEQRDRLVGFFRAIADAMLIVIGWVLWIAPIGVFALAFVVGARAGGSAFGALVHYVADRDVGRRGDLAVRLAAGADRRAHLARPLHPRHRARAGGGVQHPILARHLAGDAARRHQLGVPAAASGVTLPMAVAVFRATSPAMNMAVAIYIAYWFGHELTFAQLAIGVAAAATTTMGSVGIPGQASFITSIAPICIAMGLPIEPLALLIAVEVVPDLMRTIGNVSMDVAVTATAARHSGFTEETSSAPEDALLKDA
jgi:proton glutamate symport protein